MPNDIPGPDLVTEDELLGYEQECGEDPYGIVRVNQRMLRKMILEIRHRRSEDFVSFGDVARGRS